MLMRMSNAGSSRTSTWTRRACNDLVSDGLDRADGREPAWPIPMLVRDVVSAI